MKKQNIIKLTICIIFIVLIAYLSIFGLKIGNNTIIKSVNDIKTGLDISGGVTIIYQAQTDDGSEITQEDLKKSEAVIRKRLESKNIFDYIIRSDVSTSQINLEIPADINDTTKDPLEAVEGLDKTAKIEFRDPDGNVLLSGDDIKSAKYSEDPIDSTGLPTPHVVLTFSDEGTKKFANATEALKGKTMSIYLDTEEIMAPNVSEKIESSTAIITMGQGTYSEKKAQATEYAMLIDSGTLPFSLKVVSKEFVGPYIGQKALEVSVSAGIVALILICLIMVMFYRLPGVISSFALITYVSIILLIMSTTGISITLPGIAGLILSIGMAVDANVIIFERFKDELKNKLAPNKAFEKSFSTAMTAIVDGNVTTFAVAILLYIFGIGPIKGFGIILAIGVVTSLFTAILVTKFLLRQFMPLASKHGNLFGIKKEVK